MVPQPAHQQQKGVKMKRKTEMILFRSVQIAVGAIAYLFLGWAVWFFKGGPGWWGVLIIHAAVSTFILLVLLIDKARWHEKINP